MRKFLLYFILFICTLAFVQTKEAKLPQGILRADKIDIDWDKNTLTAYPNPTLTLPDTEAQAKQITVFLNEKGNIEKVIAEGNVLLKIVQVLKGNIKQEIEGKADKATLSGGNILILEGGAEAKVTRSDREGTSLIRADKISVDMEKKSLKAEGNVHLEFPLPSQAQGQR
jgi:lipopolysaccharide export system protein LptA